MSGGSITGNRAVYGGGICLSGSTMNFTGGTVSNNIAPLCKDFSVTPTQYYSAGGGIFVQARYFSGGVLYNWKDSLKNGQLLDYDKYKGKLTNFDQLALYTDEKGNELTQELATVLISGNYSVTRGGGIGSNGTVIMGTEGETRDITVNKCWSDPENKLSSVTVNLLANGNINRQRLLSPANPRPTALRRLRWVLMSSCPTQAARTRLGARPSL